MEQDRAYPEDQLPQETPHEAAVRIKYGLVICRWCGWPVRLDQADDHRICAWCLADRDRNRSS